MKEKFYLTTAIAYTSRIPHIGNVYEAILADAIARQKKQEGYDVYFLTGTDEHGEKIADNAKKDGRSEQEYVDYIAGEIKKIWNMVNVDYDQFIRTTDSKHKLQVQKIFKKLYDNGDIYKSFYEGLYCKPCESFFTETQLNNGNCPDCGAKVDKKSEEAYFFKLSKYQDKLLEYYEKHDDFILPKSRKNEMINNFIKSGLQDLCVSRTSFSWGVPVEFDKNHVVYVWIDALSNYITAIGYDVENKSELYKKLWPADLHIIGKDIVRFHVIYWPIILMALGEELPKTVYGHGWLLSKGNDKMSKSKGNVLYTDELVEKYGVDGVRYYVLSEMPYQDDTQISIDLMTSKYNTDLANILGNLVNRTISMAIKYFDGEVPLDNCVEQIDLEVRNLAENTYKKVEENVLKYEISNAIDSIWQLFKRLNKYIDETTPWILAKDDTKKERLATVMYTLLESIRIGAILIYPFIPNTSIEILKQLGINDEKIKNYESAKKFGGLKSGTKLEKPNPLFKRLELEE